MMFISDFNKTVYKFIDEFNYTSAPQITVIAGQKGTGKTTMLRHLMSKMKASQGIINCMMIDSTVYAKQFAYACYNKNLSSFRHYYRSPNLFLLDNLEGLKGKKKTIEELFHNMDTIIMNGGKSIITSQGEDHDFQYLGNRFSSRMNSGLILKLKKPSSEEIKQLSNHQPNFKCASSKIQRTINELTDPNDYSLPCHHGVKNYSFSEKVELVTSFLAAYFQLEKNEIVGKSQKKPYIIARYAMYLVLAELFECKYTEISIFFSKDCYYLRKNTMVFKHANQELLNTLIHNLHNQLNYREGYL